MRDGTVLILVIHRPVSVAMEHHDAPGVRINDDHVLAGVQAYDLGRYSV